MKAKIVLLLSVLVFAISLAAQTATKKPAPKPESECTTAIKATAQVIDSLAAELAKERTANEQLKISNKTLADANAELAKKNENIKTAAVGMLDKNSKDYAALVADNAALAERYNSLRDRANQTIDELNNRLASRQRAYNALAIYAAMPKYQAPVLQAPPAPVNMQLNCTSIKMGDTTRTTCQ